MSGLLSSVVVSNPGVLSQKVSSLEKHNSALFIDPVCLGCADNLPGPAMVSKGEIGHMHNEASLHLYFSPADAQMIIRKKWAERHRLARTQPWWLGGKQDLFGIGPTFLIVYAPRDEEELEILRTLVQASARYMTGRHVFSGLESEV